MRFKLKLIQVFKILKAATILLEEGIAQPVVLGEEKTVSRLVKEHKLDLTGIELIDFRSDKHRKDRYRYAEMYYDKRKRKGQEELEKFMKQKEQETAERK